MDLNHSDGFTAHSGQSIEGLGQSYRLRSCQDLMIVETMIIEGFIQKQCMQLRRREGNTNIYSADPENNS